MKQVSSLVLK